MSKLKRKLVPIFSISLCCVMLHVQAMHIQDKSLIQLHAHKLSQETLLSIDKRFINGFKLLVCKSRLPKENEEIAFEVIELLKSKQKHLFDPWAEESLPKNIDDFFEKLFLSEMSRDPQGLSSIGLFESRGIYDHNAYLNDVSPEVLLLELAEKEANLQRLKQYAFDELSPEQKISYKIFLWGLEHAVEGKAFLFHDYYISHMFGILSSLTSVFTQFHPLKTVEHVDLYITRLGSVSHQLQQCIALLTHQKELGIIPPALTLVKVINLIDKLLPMVVKKNVFYSHLAKSMKKIAMPNKKPILEKAAKVIKEDMYPAYRALQHYLKLLLDQAKDNGVWALPNGDEYYAHTLKYHTTTDLSADEIHQLGLQEVHKLQEKIEKLLKQEGLSLQDLFNNPQFYYPQTQEGRKQCLADYEAILERSRKELSHLFDLQPKASVKIQAVPRHEEEDTLACPYYVRPSLDGSRPGAFCVNLGYLSESPKFEMETVTIHEAEPGHHFQISLQQEFDMPILRKLGCYNAYAEGWALYAERLAYEQGFYSSSFAELGNLIDDMLRAVRLVVDTGIHQKKWTVDQAVAYMEKYTGFPRGTLLSEVERYFVYPGQACSYKIGQLKILELRERAKNRLGEAFDIREFHNVVLKIGSTPLTILEEVVDQYIQEKVG